MKNGKTVYINQMIPIFKYCQQELKDFLRNPDNVEYDGWKIQDLSYRKGIGIRAEIDGRKVVYNKPRKEIYIENLRHCKLEEMAKVFNIIKWEGE